MIDKRLGIAVEPAIDDELIQFCKEHDISKGAFLSAMMTELDPKARAQAVQRYKERVGKERDAKKNARKAFNQKLRSMSLEEIEAIMRAAPVKQGKLL